MSWFLAQGWVRILMLWAAVSVTAFLFLFGFRRQGEKIGELNARLRQTRRVERARTRMEKVPRPHRSDVERRLRDGDF